MPRRDQNHGERILSALAGAAAVASSTAAADVQNPLSPGSRSQERVGSLGLVTYSLTGQGQRGRIPDVPDYSDPLVFITAASKVGASAVQFPFGVRDTETIKRLRQAADRLNVALEGTLGLPRKDADMAKFESEMQTLSELGVRVARTVVFPGRRYEDLKTLDAYKAALATARDSIKRAEPIAKKHRITLAI